MSASGALAAAGVVRDGDARFQVLSPTLIRLEYAADRAFEDRPTMLAFNRRIDPPPFTSRVVGGRRVISTGHLTVSYLRGSGPFDADNLRVRVRVGDRMVRAVPRWEPSEYTAPAEGFTAAGYFGREPDTSGPRTRGNLGGWTRGLDSQRTARVLHDGLLSRDGWFFVDDSHSVVLVAGGRRFDQRPSRAGEYQDGYLFGYGHDYAAALADYRRLSGPAPLLPRKAFGVWFSRYFPYSEDDYRRRLLPRFRRERVPLDVLMVDTDFKAPRQWNGWNWRPDLFPDPRRFFRWAHRQGLDVGLNSHPSIATSDPRFSEADARAGGLIPFTLGPVVVALATDPGAAADSYYTFDWANPRHVGSYFWLHEPFEREGADFWWHDWCCEEARVNGVVPDGTVSGDAWINSWYARRNARRGTRWLSLARMGGSFEDWTGDRPGPWGEQRSTIHFTGDAYSTWPMLDFETRFTVAEGNVGLPYVSHDIGGFQGNELTDEMYVRWVQSGAFQPILRLHSSRSGDVQRLPWEFDGKARRVAARFLRLRESLIPYLYTVARQSYDTGLPLVRGMYLEWPERDAAYRLDRQYMLGSQLLVAPVGSPGDPASKRVWFPPGRWIDFFTGKRYRGPRARTLRVPLERMAVFAPAGGIVPRQPYMDYSDQRRLRLLELDVFAGRRGTLTLYEDAGEGFAYQRGQFARTPIRWNQEHRRLTIGRSRGDFPGSVDRRAYRVRFVGVRRPERIRAGGEALPPSRDGSPGWSYRRAGRTLTMRTPPTPTGSRLRIELVG
jgi:alpha-glucosidase (family GH31 glycosyl hydrolase)